MSNNVYIVSSVRSPIAKAGRGQLRDVRPEDIAAQVIKGALERVPELPIDELGEFVVGNSFPEGEQGFNVARIIALRAGLPDTVAAMTVNRLCSSGLQAIVLAADAIAAGRTEAAIGGGVESMTRIPMGGATFLPNPYLASHREESYWGMGITAEEVVTLGSSKSGLELLHGRTLSDDEIARYMITRARQDDVAYRSHLKALTAIKEGRFAEEIIPIAIHRHTLSGGAEDVLFTTDEGPRADTSIEALAKLKPAFRQGGSVTAGNSSQVSDGAAATILVNERVLTQYKLEPLARIVSFAVTGNRPGIMGVAPINAIPKALRLAGLKLEDIGLFELNEAFAAQWIPIVDVLGINAELVNPNGGAIALGHPLGCTGARMMATLLPEMRRRNVRYAIISMCVGGGMGAAAVVENLLWTP